MKVNSLKDDVYVLDDNTDIIKFMKNMCESGEQEEAFYVFDIGDVVNKITQWKVKMPRVNPYYAVKCNDCKTLLEVLAALNVNFDCASKVEIGQVVELGVDVSRIVFSNPTKMASHIRFSAEMGIELMTFDNELELYKIGELVPSAKLLIRIRFDARVSRCSLGKKFGCDPNYEAPRLMKSAKALGLQVVGVCFHVGSGCEDPSVFHGAIQASRTIFDIGTELGFTMNVLDIGGGFLGEKGTSLDETADVVNNALQMFFSSPEVHVMAEPGRYFCSSAYTLATRIHSKRENSVVSISSSVWGPTCDSWDRVNEQLSLPPMDVGDWLLYEDMGAYTLAVSCNFNGFSAPKVLNVIHKSLWLTLHDTLPLTAVNYFLGTKSDLLYMNVEKETRS